MNDKIDNRKMAEIVRDFLALVLQGCVKTLKAQSIINILIFYLLKKSTKRCSCRNKRSSTYWTVCYFKKYVVMVCLSTLTLEFTYHICNQPGHAKRKTKNRPSHAPWFHFFIRPLSTCTTKIGTYLKYML